MKGFLALLGVALAAAVCSLGYPHGVARVQASCDPSYPAICIPPPPPKLNCPDILYRDFQVVGNDPHGFDGNHDGVGCESSIYGPAANPQPVHGAEQPGSTAPTAVPAEGSSTAQSDVAGASAAPTAPVAGFGPDPGSPSYLLVAMMAGLLGAGIAWLTSGVAGAAFARVSSARQAPLAQKPPTSTGSEARVARHLPHIPPVVDPPLFRRRRR